MRSQRNAHLKSDFPVWWEKCARRRWLRTRVVTDVWGAAIDYRWQMTEFFGVTGEAYSGKALGTYNGAYPAERQCHHI